MRARPARADGRISAMKRRDFLATTAGAVVAGAVAPLGETSAPQRTDGPFAAPAIQIVRIGYVGVGGMGSAHVRNLLKVPGCRITAVCDVNPERTAWAVKAITEAGQPAPTVYTAGHRFRAALRNRADLDLVFTATPWEWHVPICLAGHEERQARRHRSARRDHARGLLGAGRGSGEARRSTA